MSAAGETVRAGSPRAVPWRAALLFFSINWALAAAAQIVLCRHLAPGEFGTANTVLGLVAVLAAPLMGFELGFTAARTSADDATHWAAARPVLMETATFAWGALALFLLVVGLPLLALPRFALQLYAILATGAALAALLSGARWLATGRRRRWMGLCFAAGAVRLLATSLFAPALPWAESGLAAVILAGLVTAFPALQDRVATLTHRAAWTWVRGQGQLLPLAASICVFFAIALLTNADRIAAQAKFGQPNAEQLGYVDWTRFDDYQAAGLLARCVLWMTLPLLLIFRSRRATMERTTIASLKPLGWYLAALVVGDILLVVLAPVWSALFTGRPAGASAMIPGFAGSVLLLGLVQGIGVVALATRRWPECFTLFAGSLAYTACLYSFGTQPALMTSCMGGGALVVLMAVLLVGVARYARTHP